MSPPKIKPRYINIGCGTHPINGLINYDYNKFIFFARISILRYFLRHSNFIPEGYKLFMDQVMEKNIRFANAGKHIPEKDNSINVVYSSHMLEHLDKEETHQFLIESRRILVTGGIIRVVVPDFDKLVNDYSENNNPEKFYTPEILEQLDAVCAKEFKYGDHIEEESTKTSQDDNA